MDGNGLSGKCITEIVPHLTGSVKCLRAIKNMANDSLRQFYTGDLCLPSAVIFSSTWHLTKVKILHVLDFCKYHCLRRLEQECWPIIPPVSAVLAIRSNQCYRLPFLSWESGPLPLEQSPQHTGTQEQLTRGQKGWGHLWGQRVVLLVSPCTYSCLYMCKRGNVRPPKKEEGIHFLADLSARCPQYFYKEFTFLTESLPTHIIIHQDGWLPTS